jgi:hypothetical protein
VAGTASTNVDCGVTISSTQFAYIRIEVLSAGGSAINAAVYIDGDVSDGVSPTKCPAFASPPTLSSVAWGWFVNVDANGALNGTFNYDIDYVRIWQDDAATPAEAAQDSGDAAPAATTEAPLVPDSSDPQARSSFFNFLAATSEDTVFDHDVYVRGTLYADKIKANQIEGLDVFANKIDSLQAKLAADGQPAPADAPLVSPGLNLSSLVLAGTTEALNFNVSGALSVGGAADFRGSAFFRSLVTFVEGTKFKGDVTLGGHVATEGEAPVATLAAAAGVATAPEDKPKAALATVGVEGSDTVGQLNMTIGEQATAGELVNVAFKKPFSKAPRVFLSPTNAETALLKYYVQSTPEGFKLVATDAITPGTAVSFNYWVVQ